jgi:hypothetical protein
VPCVEVPPYKAVGVGREVCNIVNNLGSCRLSVGVEYLVIVDADPEEIATPNRAVLLRLETCALTDKSHNARPLLLPIFLAVPGVDRGKAFVVWVIRGFGSREGERLLDAYHVALALMCELKGGNLAG